ncbi:hypothetical protein P3W85_01225 [Cupriavidus basilensis]|uniref:DUF481 domain-containing protein n=1 Tax=Cupriavidus basilensis TaxID=68895 RepID=A0ABT6AG62_9BURK|nr:TorF family putative porin [Cupriavidus basilensis]MDF3831587.1 hypothetical protein [Cupriavidus basilensis]
MSHHIANLLLALAGAGTAVPAWSQSSAGPTEGDSPAFNLSFKLAAVTDSRERGLSNSANRPTVRAAAELLHSSGAFAELEVLGVSKHQYPGGNGIRLQAVGGYRGGNPDGWHYEVGGLYSRFPGSRLPGASGYNVTIDPELDEIVDVTAIPGDVSPDTTELFGRISYRGLSLRYFHTVSENFYGINSNTVCAGINDLASSLECYEGGLKNSRGSGYFELAYLHRLSKVSAIEVRIGHQRVRNFHDFDVNSFSIEYRHSWKGFEFSAAAVGARARDRHAYDVDVGNGKARDPGKLTLLLGVSRNF